MTKYEQETVIIFNEQNPLAEIFTYNGRLLRELDALATGRPDEVRYVKTNSVGAKTYTVPKKWVKIRANRILTEEQRAKLQAQAKHMRQNQN